MCPTEKEETKQKTDKTDQIWKRKKTYDKSQKDKDNEAEMFGISQEQKSRGNL